MPYLVRPAKPSNLNVEASKNSSLSKQLKTKTIKKEQMPKKWSPSQKRHRRYSDSEIAQPHEPTPKTQLRQAMMDT